MTTDVKEEFIKELKELIKKYKIEIVVKESQHDSYSSSVDGIEFWSYAEYDLQGNCVKPCIDFLWPTPINYKHLD
ncbi:hypothetical protein [Synechococcus phage BUCT-ZZ01]|nr:hypothetical protein [Synechococcus phage BUCT-ZZ01]